MIAVIGTKKDNLSAPAFQEQDLAYAAENLMIKATEMKIGSVMLGTYPVADRYVPVSKLLNLEEGKFPFTLICLGYPLSDDAFFDKNKFKPEMVKHIGE
ncbi:MAG: nitroreductase family protein [Acholeplasmatales bacterium]|nr:nitroreductase family protein [Acholeplasmatales bacterium]